MKVDVVFVVEQKLERSFSESESESKSVRVAKKLRYDPSPQSLFSLSLFSFLGGGITTGKARRSVNFVIITLASFLILYF